MRVGIGFDVHRLAAGRRLVLCGVEIPFGLGLLGHSDADVATHAIIDSLLGAAALGDIGTHFPDSEDEYKGISSITLLGRVCDLIRKNGYAISNIDCVIAAEQPKLSSYIAQMRGCLAGAMGIGAGAVSVKATTTEQLGFEGRGEGISARAICLVQERIEKL